MLQGGGAPIDITQVEEVILPEGQVSPQEAGHIVKAEMEKLEGEQIKAMVLDVLGSVDPALLPSNAPPPGLLHHSDRGSQYTSDRYQAVLDDHHCRLSMSRVANCLDNARMESFFGTLKTERTDHRHYRTRAEAQADIFLYIEGFYNRRRRHSSLGYVRPDQFEQYFYFSLN